MSFFQDYFILKTRSGLEIFVDFCKVNKKKFYKLYCFASIYLTESKLIEALMVTGSNLLQKFKVRDFL